VSHSSITEHPVRELENGRVLLAPALRRAIAQHFPGFHQVADGAPGDFDGDGLEDALLYLSNRRRGIAYRQCTFLLVAFNQTPSGAFRPHLLARQPDPSTVYDREVHRHRRFDDYAFTIGSGTFTVEDDRHRSRQMVFPRSDVIIDSDDKLWFFGGGRYHGVRYVGDEVSE